MAQDWDDHAAGWDSNPDVLLYAEHAFDKLETVIQLDDKRVLDFGCGTGLLTEKIARSASSIVAVDSSPKMIDCLSDKQIGNITPIYVTLSQDWMDELVSRHGKFDLIVASSVCGFLKDFPETVSMLVAGLRSGGIFVQWDWLTEHDGEAFALSFNEIKRAYANAGLMLKTLESAFTMGGSDNLMHVVMAVGERP